MPTPQASVILAAAGAGRRFIEAGAANGPRTDQRPNKVFALLAGRPVLAHTLERFARVSSVAEIVVAVSAESVEGAQATFGNRIEGGRRLVFIAGGSDRAESVARALEATDRGTELVAVHDAVRPLIRPATIEQALHIAIAHGAAVVGRPVDHTVKAVAPDGRILRTVPRDSLWLAQTPQVFRREVLMQAYQHRENLVGPVTDDAQLVEAMGQAVMMVRGDAFNVKITTPEDLRLCEVLLAAGWPFEQ
ncbi:MAG: 2-C-methyl-D-erythritol 4-phosphate cytidylyltransferase [Planctomycetota bacterium]|nr:2-C-methyl-D-erythritol 4-phosphate cytidylyltransferase [Planctomycetota bacterium]